MLIAIFRLTACRERGRGLHALHQYLKGDQGKFPRIDLTNQEVTLKSID